MAILRIRRLAVIASQALLVSIALLLSWLLRFECSLAHADVLLFGMPFLVVIRLGCMAHWGSLHGYWRYTDINDVTRILSACLCGSVLFVLAIRILCNRRDFPISIYILEFILSTCLLLGVRLASRMFMEQVIRSRPMENRKRVGIIGAGFAAQILIQQLQQSQSGCEVLTAVDDDCNSHGTSIHGVRIAGSVNVLPDLVREYAIEEVLIAIPSATGPEMDRIIQICESAKVPCRTVPSLTELMRDGDLTRLREVRPEDLLARNPVTMETGVIEAILKGSTVMVTGAAGSIGRELCLQILRYAPQRLICIDQDETGMFNLQASIKRCFDAATAEYFVADINDRSRMSSILRAAGVRIIFHAAAYKHVPLVESNVVEAVKNNIFGTLQLLDLAEECGCEGFLFISSDKAVCPTSFMGCTKRVCELILAARPVSRLRCVSVRFGNVLGSQGSVVPVFQEQMCHDNTIRITHPEITRYFMTIPEAVTLVLGAFAVGEHGDIMVLDMGEPIKIVDLATHLIRLSGRSVTGIRMEFTGLRPGEKLFEELHYPSEELIPTSIAKIARTHTRKPIWENLQWYLRELDELVMRGLELEIRLVMQEIVPEYNWLKEPTLQGTEIRTVSSRVAA
jgi:FlaA1/EpsC-like NDP-sugar epimerase